MTGTKIIIGSDHRGFSLKAKLMAWLHERGYDPQDVGSYQADRCDASDFAVQLARELEASRATFGVLICGTGQAMAITANRFKHIRAALCSEVTTARLTRQHNDANVLVLGADLIGEGIAYDCLEVFLKTEFLGGRYAERRDKLTAMGGL